MVAHVDDGDDGDERMMYKKYRCVYVCVRV